MSHSSYPLVSVVIPTLVGREELLERAVESARRQTYPNIEIVVVDEGLSAPVQRNIGITRAKGDFIAFLDDDDEWLPEKIELQMKKMLQYPDCPICICYSRGKHIWKPKSTIGRDDLITFNLSPTSTFLAQRHYLQSIGGFDESLPSQQEYDLAIRITKNSKVIRCVQKILVIHHGSDGQISHNMKSQVHGALKITQKHHQHYGFYGYLKAIGLLTILTFDYVIGVNAEKIIRYLKDIYERFFGENHV